MDTIVNQHACTRRRALLDQWDDTANEMHEIERAALDYLSAIQNRRDSTYAAAEVARLDTHASDFAGRAIDLLSDIHGDAQTAADEEGVDPAALTYDAGTLLAEYKMWAARVEARR